jgi:uncharacterized protein involved in response to NO
MPIHANLMIVGFLFSYSLGFLMTAVPRFTGAAHARRWEIAVAVVLSLSSFSGVYPNAIAMAVLAFLAFFFLSRIRTRTYSPPKHFVFIPLGLLLGLAGAALMMMGSLAGRVFLYQGTMLCFVLGVGGKLVSALLGWSAPPLVQIETAHTGKRGCLISFDVALPVALLTAGFLLEFTAWQMLARILRALSATYVGLSAWKLFQRPKIRGRLSNWLWISCWGLVSGSWLYALSTLLGTHGLHLMFICGFGLMTLIIASRVTLAHGGYDLELESKSRSIRWMGVFILAAALTRVTAPLTPSYLHHLTYAAGAWLIALLIWSAVFVPRMIMMQSPLKKE